MATTTVDRAAWEAMLHGLTDGDTEQSLRDELAQWDGGDTCERIAVTLDSMGRLDSMSSPRPATEVENDYSPAE